jgi:hypothetical protein
VGGSKMNKRDVHVDASASGGPQLRAALDQLCKIVVDGLQHGYFDGTISIEIRKSDLREMKIKAGRSYKFNIPIEELPR